MSLKTVMCTEVVRIGPDRSVATAAKLMEESGVGSLVVMQDGAVLGMLTDRDVVLRVLNQGRDPAVVPVEQVMTMEVSTLTEDMEVHEALGVMKGTPARRFPVVDAAGHLTGLLALDDVLLLIAQELADVAHIIDQERRPS